MQFGFQMLVDEQQRFQRPAHIAIARCDDFLDRHFSPLGSHLQSPAYATPLGAVSRGDWGGIPRRNGSFGGAPKVSKTILNAGGATSASSAKAGVDLVERGGAGAKIFGLERIERRFHGVEMGMQVVQSGSTYNSPVTI